MAHRASGARGHAGRDVAGAGFRFDIEIRLGAGAYICGEETALFESIEGKRGEPRNKPPFPVEVGLFGKPTVVNNVETLVNVPLILVEGGAAYGHRHRGLDRPEALLRLRPRRAPGLYEVPFGATLRELLELAGGVPAAAPRPCCSAARRACSSAGRPRPAAHLRGRPRGGRATLGSGVVMAFDESADLVDTVRRIAAFFRDESCGQCVPCRVGTVRQEELLATPRAAAADAATASWRCASSAGDARRLDLRPRPDGAAIERRAVGRASSRGCDGVIRTRPPTPGVRLRAPPSAGGEWSSSSSTVSR